MLRVLFPRPFLALLVAFAGLALIYGVAVPVFEAPDETTHVGMIQHVATTGELPVQRVGEDTIYAQEGSQPPLYYLLTALIFRAFDRSDYAQALAENPHAIVGIPGAVGNKNITLHDQLYPPRLQGTALAVYAVRLFSMVLGLVTVTAVYQSARLLAPQHRGVALLAAGLTAFNPQFVFSSGSVNNDNLVAMFGSLLVWQILVMLRDGLSTRRGLLLALCFALASISKLSGLVFGPALALAALWVVFQRRDWRGLMTLAGLVLGSWLLIAGWWYLRNLTLYGELFGTQMMLDIFGRRPAPPLLDLILEEFEGLRISYWGLFGWFNVFTVRAYYWVMDLVVLVAVVGLLRYLWLHRKDLDALLRVLLLLLILAAGGASLIAWTSQTSASAGRLLFPYVAAISGLLALGLSALRISAPALVAPLGLFALAVPFVSIIPTYAPPAPLETLPTSAQQIYARYGEIELLGYETPGLRYAPGDTIPVTLYWRPVAQSDVDYSLFVHLLDRSDEAVAKEDSYPGAGSLRTTSWHPGAIYSDSYLLQLPDDLSGRYALRFLVGWWQFPGGDPLPPVDEAGQSIGVVTLAAGAFTVGDDSNETLATAVEAHNFGGQFRLLTYTLEGDLLRLQWQALAAPSQDYTVLAHVLDAPGGRILGQGDTQPTLPTSDWREGEVFISEHRLFFDVAPAPGSYPLLVGWYSPADFTRLAADCPNDACWITDVAIPEE